MSIFSYMGVSIKISSLADNFFGLRVHPLGFRDEIMKNRFDYFKVHIRTSLVECVL